MAAVETEQSPFLAAAQQMLFALLRLYLLGVSDGLALRESGPSASRYLLPQRHLNTPGLTLTTSHRESLRRHFIRTSWTSSLIGVTGWLLHNFL